MKLNLRDTEVDNALAATVRNIDHDYQAEQWVLDTYATAQSTNPARWVTEWERVDDDGVRARWERNDGDPSFPRLAFAAARFTGQKVSL